jgi:hypothetical protein
MKILLFLKKLRRKWLKYRQAKEDEARGKIYPF